MLYLYTKTLNKNFFMDTNSLKNDSFDAKTTLTNWLAEVSAFYIYYQELTTFVNYQKNRPIFLKNDSTYIGQYPIDSLSALMTTMQGELVGLLFSMEQLNQQSASGQFLKKLVAHTRILNQLNHQALLVLDLVARPSS